MLRELLQHTTLTHLPLGAMFLFLAVFVGVVARTFSRRAAEFDALARAPLGSDEGGAGR
jgi:cytochrome c oxidase cbb3-type subunit 4